MSNNTQSIRRNAAIRAREVRVLDPEGKQLGVMSTSDALRVANQYGVDLIEISPNANPPVCRIMDFGKFRYELSKKEKDQNKTAAKLKEIKFRVRIEQNDYLTKLRHAEEFLLENNKVKLTMFFRGREMGHTNLGMEVIVRAISDLSHVATADNQPRLSGRSIGVMLSPLPQAKRKAKYSKGGDSEVTPTNTPDDESDTEE